MKWYCIRSQPKHEHIAAGHLRSEAGLEVFLPRIRFRRSTREGPVWFTEALFPNYLFGRFDLESDLRRVHHTTGVSGVIHFGTHYPEVPIEVMKDLQTAVGTDQIHVVPPELSPGDEVQVSGGAFHDLKAVVTRVMPGRDRVAVLLNFLGRQTSVELPLAAVIKQGDARASVR